MSGRRITKVMKTLGSLINTTLTLPPLLIDPIFLSIFADIFTALASSRAPNVYETVVEQALPVLCNTIGSAKTDDSWIVSSAIELVSSLVKGAPDNCLGDGFFSLLAPNLFPCLAQAEDRDVLQVG